MSAGNRSFSDVGLAKGRIVTLVTIYQATLRHTSDDGRKKKFTAYRADWCSINILDKGAYVSCDTG
jgi:hypothetical protein